MRDQILNPHPTGRGSFWASSIGRRALKRSLALWMGPEGGWVGRWWVEGRLGGRIEKKKKRKRKRGRRGSEKILIQEVEQGSRHFRAGHFRAG